MEQPDQEVVTQAISANMQKLETTVKPPPTDTPRAAI